MRQIKGTLLLSSCAIAVLALWVKPSHAIDFKLADFDVTAHGGLTYGTTIRADDRDASLLLKGNGARVGVSGTAPSGNNSDDGDLNFAKGDTVSTVVKGVFGADIRKGAYGLAVRAKAWQDLTLGETNPAFGAPGNGYSSNRPLRDAGFPERSKFSGAVLQDVYVYGAFEPWGMPLNARFGNQFLSWGSGWAINGGISALNPVDLPAVRRAGALPEEMLVPIPMLYGKLNTSENTTLEGFYQFRFRPTELDGCGTFFSAYDYLVPGCNTVIVAPNSTFTDPTLFAAGSIAKRALLTSRTVDKQGLL